MAKLRCQVLSVFQTSPTRQLLREVALYKSPVASYPSEIKLVTRSGFINALVLSLQTTDHHGLTLMVAFSVGVALTHTFALLSLQPKRKA